MAKSKKKGKMWGVVLLFVLIVVCGLLTWIMLNSTTTLVPLPTSQSIPVVLGGICRNIESSFPHLKNILVSLQTKLPDLDIYLFENNSTDQTKRLLTELAEEMPRLHIQMVNVTESEMASISTMRALSGGAFCRMELIAWARNQLLQMMNLSSRSEVRYVMMLDADVRALAVDTVVDLIHDFPSEWDAVFANGRAGASYYDYYALRYPAYPFGPEVSVHALARCDEFRFTLNEQESKWTPVYSAFGGFAIYRAQCFLGCPGYTAQPTPALNQFYQQMKQKHGTHPLAQDVRQLVNGDMVFVSNCGYDGSVVCEHVTLHAWMKSRGTGRFAIYSPLVYEQ